MAYKKVFIAVDCENEQEVQRVQAMAKELSETLMLKARDLIGFYPILQKNKALIYSVVNTIAKEGKKGLFRLVPMLLKSL